MISTRSAPVRLSGVATRDGRPTEDAESMEIVDGGVARRPTPQKDRNRPRKRYLLRRARQRRLLVKARPSLTKGSASTPSPAALNARWGHVPCRARVELVVCRVPRLTRASVREKTRPLRSLRVTARSLPGARDGPIRYRDARSRMGAERARGELTGTGRLLRC